MSEIAETLERLEELLVSGAVLSFDRSRVAVCRDDLRTIVRQARLAISADAAAEGRAARCRMLEDENDALKRALETEIANRLAFYSKLLTKIIELEEKVARLSCQ